MLDALNSQMRANQVALKQRAADDAAAAAAQLAQRETEVQDLKEQVLLIIKLLSAAAYLAVTGSASPLPLGALVNASCNHCRCTT